jgi:hypothetical protein
MSDILEIRVLQQPKRSAPVARLSLPCSAVSLALEDYTRNRLLSNKNRDFLVITTFLYRCAFFSFLLLPPPRTLSLDQRISSNHPSIWDQWRQHNVVASLLDFRILIQTERPATTLANSWPKPAICRNVVPHQLSSGVRVHNRLFQLILWPMLD